MNVLMIAPEPFFESRGTPFSVYYRCQAMAKFGVKIDLVTYHIGEKVKLEKGVKLHRIPNVPFVKKMKIGPSLTKFYIDPFVFFKSLSMLFKNKYDAIHVHEEAVFFGAIFKFFFRKKLIYDMHSSIPDQLINYNFNKQKWFVNIFEWFEKKYLNYSDALICICPALKDKAASKLKKNVPIFVIENSPLSKGHDKAPKKEVEKIRKQFNLEGKKVATYTGSLGYQQGLEVLIDSAKYLREEYGDKFKILLVGGGNENYIEEMKQSIKKKGVEDVIIFAGYWPVEKMGHFDAITDVLVSPRLLGTNTPLKIYSYLNSGVPIVATDLITHTQVLNNEVSVLTKPNGKAFAEGIKKVLNNDKFAKELVKAAFKLSKKEFSMDAYLKKSKQFVDYISK